MTWAPAFDFTRLGFRVPTVICSPWVPKGQVDSTRLQHTSVLATLNERNWEIAQFPISAAVLADLIGEVIRTGLPAQRSRDIYNRLLEGGGSVKEAMDALGIRVVGDESALREITVPLIGSTITPVVVFIPLIAITGVTGVFFRALAVTMSVSLLTSLVLAVSTTRAKGALYSSAIVWRAAWLRPGC